MPIVSVLMASHRDTAFLRPAIASVLAQTMADLELVLVDNGAGLATDALGESGRDPRLRLIHWTENRGIPAAHNAALAASSGEFIALLDHDDVMRPERLERQIDLLRARPSLGLVASLAETIDVTGRVTGREFALMADDDQRRYSAYASPVVTPAYTGRRATFTTFPYREQFSLTADFDFVARAAEQCELGAVPKVLTGYRRHAGQATQEQAALIEWQRGQVRLCTARRRAGRAEGDAIAGAAGQSPVGSCLALASRALKEGFFALAAYQARRAVALERNPIVATQAAILAAQILACSGGAERSLAARMFFQGPVRALAVRNEA